MSALTCIAAVLAGQYAETSRPLMVRQAKHAPSSPSIAARSRARSSVAARHRSSRAAASGRSSVRAGTTNPSTSQKL
jgi:hypothetical protein